MMKKTSLFAALIAGAFCLPAFAQTPESDPLASIEEALDSFKCDAVQLAAFDAEGQRAPEQAFRQRPSEFQDLDEDLDGLQLAEGPKPKDGPGQQGGCPMMQGPGAPQGGCPMMQGKGPGSQGGCPMMAQQRGKPGKGNAMRGSKPDRREMLAARLAEEDPAKYAELKKLRDQEAQIMKDFMAKQKAEREEFKKLVDDYKKAPSDDLKAKIQAKIASKFDAKIKAKETRLEEASKKIADVKKEKDQKVAAIFDKIIAGKRQDGPKPPAGAQPPPPPAPAN